MGKKRAREFPEEGYPDSEEFDEHQYEDYEISFSKEYKRRQDRLQKVDNFAEKLAAIVKAFLGQFFPPVIGLVAAVDPFAFKNLIDLWHPEGAISLISIAQ